MTNANQIDLLGDVVNWLRDHLRLSKSKILMPETRINLDLGVDGDDGAELLTAFAERFDVDMSVFQHVRYFGPEAGASPMSFFRRILEIAGMRDARVLDPLFIKDLVELVNRGRHSAVSRRPEMVVGAMAVRRSHVCALPRAASTRCGSTSC